MGYEILRMPKTDEGVKNTLLTIEPFLAAMHPPEDDTVHGEFNFSMDHFLFLWHAGGVFLLLKRDDAGEPIMVAFCTQYNDLWTNRKRIEIQKVAMRDTLDEEEEKQSMVKYLKGVASLLKFDQLFYNISYADGSILRQMVWNDKG